MDDILALFWSVDYDVYSCAPTGIRDTVQDFSMVIS